MVNDSVDRRDTAGHEGTLAPWNGRAIILLDLDAFFASVEQLDHPDWRGKPVIVGGDAQRRGVVSTCSYEARTYGVRSAMPAVTAHRLCPDAIWTPGNFSRYKEVSDCVMAIMRDESPFIQQVSIDEAFLDISPSAYNPEHPVLVAQRIQARVDELGVTCSIGLGVSKSVAKVASDFDKPHGLTVVYPGREEAFLAPLPLKDMSGIGPKASKKLEQMGMRTLGDVASADLSLLNGVFGKNAQMMQDRCKGADRDEVESGDPVKSVSNEISFAQDISTRDDVIAALRTVAAKVARRLRMKGLRAGGLSLKMRYADRSVRQHQCQLSEASDSEYVFLDELESMIDEVWAPGVRVRLLGVSAFKMQGEGDSAGASQLSLFGDDEAPFAHEHVKLDTLSQATDAVRNRFGEHAVQFGREMRTRQNLTGSSSKNPADYKD